MVEVARDTDTKEIPPCLIRKSDGAALYATSDLGTIIEREEDFHPDRYIYVVDKRQEMHFIQVFRVAKMAGIVKEENTYGVFRIRHHERQGWKPFKTRDGGVMRLEKLIGEIDEAVYGRIMENRTVDSEEAMETAKIVGLAALKYGICPIRRPRTMSSMWTVLFPLKATQDLIFFIRLCGSNPFLNKYQDQGGEPKQGKILPAAAPGEKDLMLRIARFSEVMVNSFEEMAPHKICQYIYELANSFNSFYHDTKILSEEDEERKKSYIALISLAKQVLETCIQVLGI